LLIKEEGSGFRPPSEFHSKVSETYSLL